MAGVEFDRQVFVSASAPTASTRKSLIQLVTSLLLVMVLGLVSYVGYKVYLVNQNNTAASSANEEITRLQQQIGDMQKRLDFVERHKRAAPPEPAPNPESAVKPGKTTPPVKTRYHVVSASALPAQPKSPNLPASAATTVSSEIAGQLATNHEAWEATTNRLADVVGVVGTQQAEITATRDAVNQLLGQSRRQAISFEIDKSNNRVAIGPITLEYKAADSKAQRYSICVKFGDQKCIDLKDRALNEVVVFIVAKNTAPLELVATRIQHGQVAGYVAVPTAAQ
jgi:hypothetical protein